MPPLLALLAALCLAPLVAACAPAPLSDWAGVVVAGDDHAAHSDDLTETFDNARRDVTAALVARGFSAADLAQFSLRPGRYQGAVIERSDIDGVFQRLRAERRQAPGGCLVYVTSHGAPDGVVVGEELVSSDFFARGVGRACGRAPTAIILSACFSGGFVADLRAPNRFILTAARADRSSFGCGESDTYPFFDGCVIERLPAAVDFVDLGRRVRACVAARERDQRMSPPSEPQIFVGAAFQALTPRFAPPPFPQDRMSAR